MAPDTTDGQSALLTAVTFAAQVACPELVNRIHYNNVIGIMGRHKQYGAALQVFEELRAQSDGDRRGDRGDAVGSGPDVVSYTAVVTACAHAGRWRVAASWFRRMEAEGIQPNRWVRVSALR
eukprot:9214303-Pyramimonas_sp.AAC.4